MTYINYLEDSSNNYLIVMVGTPMAFNCLTADVLDVKKPHARNPASSLILVVYWKGKGGKI